MNGAAPVLIAGEIGRHIYHPKGVDAALRDEIMRSKSPSDWYASLDWLCRQSPWLVPTPRSKRLAHV